MGDKAATASCPPGGSASDSPIRVLLLAPTYSIHTSRFVRGLLEAGHLVTLLDVENLLDEQGPNFRFVKLLSIRGTDRFARWGGALLANLVWQAQLKLAAWRCRPDVVNVHWVDFRASLCVAAGLRPLVLSCWGSDISNLSIAGQRDEAYRAKIARALRAADYVTADSQQMLNRCNLLAGRELPGKLFYFGIVTSDFHDSYTAEEQALRRSLGIAREAKVLLSCRGLRPIYCQSDILQAFAEIAHEDAMSDVVLVFRKYGIDDDVMAQLHAQIKQWGLEPRVFWLEPAVESEIPIQLTMASVVVNYPCRDAFPVSFFEAAACRRPIVSSDLTDYHGAFGDAITLVAPNQPAALASALRNCIAELNAGSEQLQRRLDTAFELARTLGDRSTNIEVMTTVFRAVMEPRRQSATASSEPRATTRQM